MFNTITHQQFLLLVKAFLKSLVGKKPVISQQEYDIFVINTRPRQLQEGFDLLMCYGVKHLVPYCTIT